MPLLTLSGEDEEVERSDLANTLGETMKFGIKPLAAFGIAPVGSSLVFVTARPIGFPAFLSEES